MDRYNTYMQSSDPQTLSIHKRLTPMIKTDSSGTEQTESAFIPHDLLLLRIQNIEATTDLNYNDEQKRQRNPFHSQHVEVLSYVPGDLVYFWGSPYNDTKLWKEEKGWKVGDKTSYKTIEEGVTYCDNEHRALTVFNGLEMETFIKDRKEGTLTFPTSEDWMNAMRVKGFIAKQSFVVNSFNMSNADDKKITIPVTRKLRLTWKNFCSNDHKPKVDDNGAPILITGENQWEKCIPDQDKGMVPDGAELEWYIPYYDQNKEHRAFFKKGNDWEISTKYLESWRNLEPEEYRGDERYRILQRVYNPTRENALREKLKKKSLVYSLLCSTVQIVGDIKDGLDVQLLAVAYAILTNYTAENPKNLEFLSNLNLLKYNGTIFEPKWTGINDNNDILGMIHSELVNIITGIEEDFTKNLSGAKKQVLNFFNWIAQQQSDLFKYYEMQRHILRKRIFAKVYKGCNEYGKDMEVYVDCDVIAN